MKFTSFATAVSVIFPFFKFIVAASLLKNSKIDGSDIKQNQQGLIDPNALTMEISNYDTVWKQTFGENYATSKASMICSDTTKTAIKIRKLDDQEIKQNEKQYGQFPQEAPYLMYKAFGFDDSAYFLDYLDRFLSVYIKPAFEFLMKDMKNAPSNKNIPDPYEPDLLKSLYKQFKPEAKIEFTEVSKVGVRVPQIESLFNKYSIPIVNKSHGWEKAMLDKFDKNGDGILSYREAMFMILWEGRKYYDKQEFLKPLTDSLDPIFKFIDCDNDGLIHAEGLMKAVQNLKLEDTKFNIFSCMNPKNHQYLRSNSFSDVILKNSGQMVGMLNKHEFRAALILGMWDRMMIDNADYGDSYNTFNQMPLRWDEDGKVDKMCPYK